MKPKLVTTPKPSLVKAFRARDTSLLEAEFRKALDIKTQFKRLNALNVLLASSLQGYIETMNLPMPEERTLTSMWSIVRNHLTLSPHYEMPYMRPVLEGLTQGLVFAVEGLSLTAELEFTGRVVNVSTYPRIRRWNHIEIFAYAVYTLILVLLELDDFYESMIPF